jgi:hypothetical protein
MGILELFRKNNSVPHSFIEKSAVKISKTVAAFLAPSNDHAESLLSKASIKITFKSVVQKI